MSPTLLLLSNPAALRKAMETGGSSLTAGARNLLSDLKEGRLSMVDTTAQAEEVIMGPGGFAGLPEEWQLVIVGDGPEVPALRRLAGPTIEFKGWLPDDELRQLYSRCSGLIFPGEEDFGIVPVEAIACGKPVIAYARGGALETVREQAPPATGVFFQEQSVDALLDAVARCKRTRFDGPAMRQFALGFDRERYKHAMAAYTERRWRERGFPQPHATKEVIGLFR